MLRALVVMPLLPRSVILALVLLLGMSPAEAQWDREPPEEETLWNGGTVPFILMPAVTTFGLHFFAEPPEEPLFFSVDEGGEETEGDTVPEWTVAAWGVAGFGAMAALGNESRLYQMKGYAQALTMTLAATEIAKNVVGRRRPHYNEMDDDKDLRRSFFSGHASVMAASSTYLSLYVLRGSGWVPHTTGERLARYGVVAGLAGLAVAVPATRISDRRHHVSDVLTGSAVGGILGATFYLYQEQRYRLALAKRLRLEELWIGPARVGQGGMAISGRF